MDAGARLDAGNRWANAGAAAGVGLAAVAMPTLAMTGMFTTPRYGESFVRSAGRAAAPIVAGFALPTAIGAFAGTAFGSTGGSSASIGALAGATTGALVGATIMHPIMTAGLSNPPSRLVTMGLFLGAGALMGAAGGGLGHATVEHR